MEDGGYSCTVRLIQYSREQGANSEPSAARKRKSEARSAGKKFFCLFAAFSPPDGLTG